MSHMLKLGGNVLHAEVVEKWTDLFPFPATQHSKAQDSMSPTIQRPKYEVGEYVYCEDGDTKGVGVITEVIKYPRTDRADDYYVLLSNETDRENTYFMYYNEVRPASELEVAAAVLGAVQELKLDTPNDS